MFFSSPLQKKKLRNIPPQKNLEKLTDNMSTQELIIAVLVFLVFIQIILITVQIIALWYTRQRDVTSKYFQTSLFTFQSNMSYCYLNMFIFQQVLTPSVLGSPTFNRNWIL